MDELKRYLLDAGIWERELDEVYEMCKGNDGIQINCIFDSTFDLGEYYIDSCIGSLDRHIDAVLDYAVLGKHIAEVDDEYEMLSSGRIIEFVM